MCNGGNLVRIQSGAAIGCLRPSFLLPASIAWSTTVLARYRIGAVSGSYGVLHLGVDRLVHEDLAIGLILSLDRMEEDDGPNGRQESSGWMAGP